MVSDPYVYLALVTAQFTAGALTLLALLRIGYILSANPIGEFTQELVYLRIRELRNAALVLFLVILIETGEHLILLLEYKGWITMHDDATLYANAVQSVLVLSAMVMTLMVVRRYTHRSLDRRIRESMETLAYLETQRRRRRALERGDWDRTGDE